MSKTTTKPSPSNAVILTIPLPAAEKIMGVSAAVAGERHALLTLRERQVAGMMATGKPNREIAAELGISVKTLDIHRERHAQAARPHHRRRCQLHESASPRRGRRRPRGDPVVVGQGDSSAAEGAMEQLKRATFSLALPDSGVRIGAVLQQELHDAGITTRIAPGHMRTARGFA